MPIYEYQCKECDHQFEAMRKVSDGPPDACPACGKNALQKLVSRVGFRLKGTGWYETDFKTKSADKKTSDSGDSPKGDKKEPAKKAESSSTESTKPAASSES
jgi:putative FmdB family regulatory protein